MSFIALAASDSYNVRLTSRLELESQLLLLSEPSF